MIYRHKPDALLRDVAEGVVIYDPATDCAFLLNGSAAAIWAMVNGNRSVEEIVAILKEDMGDPEGLRAQVRQAFHELATHGLLVAA